jgi:aldose sugar dehydrogenase
MKTLTKFFILLLVVILIILAAIWLFIFQNKGFPETFFPETLERSETEVNKTELPESVDIPIEPGENQLPNIVVVASGLSIPWDLVFLPIVSEESGKQNAETILFTERTGNLVVLRNGTQKKVQISDTEHVGEGGLLGLTAHPNFSSNRFIYLYHTAQVGEGLMNRVVRYEFKDDTLTNQRVIIANIPGAQFHDGGRITFGPVETNQSGQAERFLYITTGDAQKPALAQDINSLAGKILRLHDDGRIPEDNPFGNAVWSYGHRNPQGLAWDSNGQLWSTEHGPSSALWPNCCQDEINFIEKGKNYGWPDSIGDKVLAGTAAPITHSSTETWAPASALYWRDSLFFGGLRGSALYEAVLNGQNVLEIKEHFKNEFGRIRTVALGPDGMFYLTTSNRDGRGNPKSGDDKIIKINPQVFR